MLATLLLLSAKEMNAFCGFLGERVEKSPKRSRLLSVPLSLALLAFICVSTSTVRAAFPLSATLNSTDTQPISWIGTATGPGSTSSVATCREGVDCDTFILTIGGAAADWTGKVAYLQIDWSLPSSDFDLYILRRTADGVTVVAQSVNHPTNTQETHERVILRPNLIGTGEYLVRVMYTVASFADQYRANAIAKSVTNGKIAFTNMPNAITPHISTINPDGSNQTQLTSDSTIDYDFAWAPNGNSLVFSSYRDSHYQLYSMEPNGNNQTRLTNTVTFANDSSPAWSADSSKIAFVSGRDSNAEIYSMNADGSHQMRLTFSLAIDKAPSWSPDGSKIAFLSTRDGNTYEIYVMDSNGFNPTRLTFNTVDEVNPVWSPDGSKIAFAIERGFNNYAINVMNADGSNPIHLSDASYPYFSWSPDGAKLAFGSWRNGNNEIYVANSNGTNQTRLTNHLDVDFNPVWSPDGNKIAFLRRNNSAHWIYVINADGTNQTQLTINATTIGQLGWQAQ